jgi:uncharacterized protein
MKIVLDTNILLISLPKRSPFRSIFDQLLKGSFQLFVTNDIISEYFEIIETKSNFEVASNVVELLLSLQNVTKIEVYYKWELISEDYDDNKFVDCAISANADFIVTNDKHFEILKRITFPKVKVINDEAFLNKIS